MLVHTALNKAIRTTFDPYFTNLKYIFNCRAGAPISQTFTLLSCNVVYAIQCKLCRIIYVGETGATIKQRLYQHIYHIQKGTNDKRLYTHFISNHINNFSLSGLETNVGWSLVQWRAAERRWIFRLSSTAPFGLNDDHHVCVFLLWPRPSPRAPPPSPYFLFFIYIYMYIIINNNIILI